MAFESMSTENRIQNGLRELDASLNFFAALQDDVSVSTLQKALNGTRVLENDYAAPLLRLLRELQSIQRECVPYPVAFKVENVALFRELLATRRQQGPKPAEAIFNVYFSENGTVGQYFVQRQRNYAGKFEIKFTSFPSSAASFDRKTAERICASLVAQGYKAAAIAARDLEDSYPIEFTEAWAGNSKTIFNS
jgi:hypothetical protein